MVVQGGPWPLLLYPFRLLGRRTLFHWLAQPVLSRCARFVVRVCDDVVFTATTPSLPTRSSKVRVVGHGIDVTRFRPVDGPPLRDALVAGRISPANGIEEMVVALARATELYGSTATLDIVGNAARSDTGYHDRLQATVARLGLADRVRFLGVVPYDKMPDLVVRYRLVLNFSRTALDKAVVEAMAAGVPVLSTNPCVAEILADDLAPATRRFLRRCRGAVSSIG